MGGVTRLHGVLVTYRRPADLDRTLGVLHGQTRRLDSLVLVDNSPGADTRALVDRWRTAGLPLHHLESEDNLGPAGGIARGMEVVLDRASDDDWVVVLDDDDPPRDAAVLAGLEEFANHCRGLDPDTAAAGSLGARFDWRRGRTTRPYDVELVGRVPVDYIGGNRFPFYRAGALREVGLPWPELFFGLDDLELGLRLRRHGYHLYARGEGWAAQRRAAGRPAGPVRPSRRLDEPTWRRYYSLRNSIAILRRYGATAAAVRVTLERGLVKPLVNLPREPRLALRHLRLTTRACRDGWTGRMGRTIPPGGVPPTSVPPVTAAGSTA